MSIQEKEGVARVNTKEGIKDTWIQIRVSSELKETLKQRAEEQEKTLSQYILDSVLTNHNNIENVNTIKILCNGINAFNKLLKYNQNKGDFPFPDNINPNKIFEALKICRMKLI